MRTMIMLALLFAIGCGGGQDVGQDLRDRWLPVARTAATRNDLTSLLARLTSEQLCKQLDGRFVPISAEDPPPGPAAGMAVSTGRWWIRRCTAALRGSYIVEFSLDGAGWVWVDMSKLGFGVTQAVYFQANGGFRGTLDLLTYDPMLDVASIVFHPWGPPVVQSAPVGEIDAYAQNAGAMLFQISPLGWFGVHDSIAADEARLRLRKAFERRLSTDITATLDVRTGQFDFVLQPLGPGVAPLRPIRSPMSERERFVADEIQELHPNVPQVIGPLDPAAGALIDFVVQGPPVRYRCECKQVIDAAFAPVLSGMSPHLPPLPLAANAGVASGTTTRSVSLPCRWYLVTETDAPTFTTAAVRIRGSTWIGFPVQ